MSRAPGLRAKGGKTLPNAVPPAISLTLVEAMVGTSDTPLLLLDGNLDVVAASASFCHAFGLDCPALVGHPIFAMGNGEWDLVRLRSLLTSVASGGAKIANYEMDLTGQGDRGDRCLVLNAHKLDYDGPDSAIRLLLSISDQTDSRAAKKVTEQLLADKLLLNRELQHRVANSLQIIASVLMQSARRVGSEESRQHLNQAHNRVLSIAAVQKQLAETGAESVALRPYLTQLCASISASMIADAEKISIVVDVDDSSVASDVSVSLGLIVTELVINALKHAFPDDHAGKIKVCYERDDDAWLLEIADDGVGMPAQGAAPATPGLGTSIVEALVRQRGARITVIPGHPGTTVSIRHEPAGTAGADILPLKRAV